MTAAPPPFDRERRGRRFSRGCLRRGRTGQRNALAADRTELRVSQSRLFRGAAAGSAVRRSGAFGRPEGCPAGRVSGRGAQDGGPPVQEVFFAPEQSRRAAQVAACRMSHAGTAGLPSGLRPAPRDRSLHPLRRLRPACGLRRKRGGPPEQSRRLAAGRRMPSGPIPINLVNFATKKIFFRKTDTSCRFF